MAAHAGSCQSSDPVHVQMAFQSCLEDMEPPISSRCAYRDVARHVPDDPAFRELPEAQRMALFEEVRLAAASVEETPAAAVADVSAAVAQPAEQPAQPHEEASGPDAARSATAQDQSELDALKAEQVCMSCWCCPQCRWHSDLHGPRTCGAEVMQLHGGVGVFAGAAQGGVRADGGQAAGDGGAAAGRVWCVRPAGFGGATVHERQHAALRGLTGRGGATGWSAAGGRPLQGPPGAYFPYWVLLSCLLMVGAPGACLCLREMPTFGPRNCSG